MKQRSWLIVAFLVSCFCVHSSGANRAGEQPIDANLATRADVVLRVELLKSAEAIDKYGWDQVKVLEVLKNEPKAEFPKELAIAFRNTDAGVPKGKSTVYLVPYRTPPDGRRWRLVASSHAEPLKHTEPRRDSSVR